jgi:hypothetical protein
MGNHVCFGPGCTTYGHPTNRSGLMRVVVMGFFFPLHLFSCHEERDVPIASSDVEINRDDIQWG